MQSMYFVVGFPSAENVTCAPVPSRTAVRSGAAGGLGGPTVGAMADRASLGIDTRVPMGVGKAAVATTRTQIRCPASAGTVALVVVRETSATSSIERKS